MPGYCTCNHDNTVQAYEMRTGMYCDVAAPTRGCGSLRSGEIGVGCSAPRISGGATTAAPSGICRLETAIGLPMRGARLTCESWELRSLKGPSKILSLCFLIDSTILDDSAGRLPPTAAKSRSTASAKAQIAADSRVYLCKPAIR